MSNYTYTDSYKFYINITKIKLKWYVATHIILLHNDHRYFRIFYIHDKAHSLVFTLENSSQLFHE